MSLQARASAATAVAVDRAMTRRAGIPQLTTAIIAAGIRAASIQRMALSMVRPQCQNGGALTARSVFSIRNLSFWGGFASPCPSGGARGGAPLRNYASRLSSRANLCLARRIYWSTGRRAMHT